MRSGERVSQTASRRALLRRGSILAALVLVLMIPAARSLASASAHPGFVVLNGRLYFSFQPNAGLEQLYSYNSLNGSQTPLTSLPAAPAAGVIVVGRLVSFNGTIFFAGRDSNGLEPWKYDPGTGLATQLKDINPGTGDSNPASFVGLGSTLYFSANDGGGGQIWAYDGTNTTKVTTISGAADASPRDLTVFNGKVYFSAEDSSARQLWAYTPGGSAAKITINGGSAFPTNLTVFNGMLYMQATNGVAANRELWACDASNAVALVKELAPGGVGGEPSELTVLNGKLYFRAFDGSETRLWVSKTDNSTTEVSQTTAGFGSVANLIAPSFSANTLFFSQTSSGAPGLWKLDATSDTVSFVTNIGAWPADFAEAKGKLYFTAADGTQLDQFDPAGAGTLTTVASGSNLASLTGLNNALFYVGNAGQELDYVPLIPAATAGAVVISEFRLAGPGGVKDEYVELANKTTVPVVVEAADGTAGWAVIGGDGLTRFVIPNDTTIPASGHYLGANTGYTLAAYAAADAPFTDTTDIPDDSGLALYNSGSLISGTRLDAAGFSSASASYREGSGLAPIGATTAEHAFLRNLASGVPADTNVNVSDFVFVSTTAANIGGVQSILGAPGPENLASPLQRNASIPGINVEPNVGPGVAPNKVRINGPIPNYPIGALEFRRRYTNNTEAAVTRLRFRAVNMTTLQSPGYTPGTAQADLRLTTGPDVSFGPTSINASLAKGLTLDTPPSQPLGGGWNSTATLVLGTPLAPGDWVDVNLRVGLIRGGVFQFFVNVEALP